jgi:hypothetical protein
VKKNLDIEKEVFDNFSNNDWGILLYPEEKIEVNILNCDPGEDGVKLVMVKNGSTILKEPRLFSFNCGKLSLEGIPHIEGQKTNKCLGILINNKTSWVSSEMVENWVKKNPFSSQACYWLMDLYAGREEWEKCSSEGRRFLFVTGNRYLEESVNVNYKIACSDLMIGKIQQCVESLIFCLAINPSFAEAWCLLGDIFCLNKQINRASSFYKNAILSGKLRDFHDAMLIMTEKYEDHPKKMLKEIGY